MTVILSGNNYMTALCKIHKDCFTCAVLSCSGNVKVRTCIYPNGKADLYRFNGTNYGVNDVDVSALYAFVKDKINSKKLEQYIDNCYKNWQDTNSEYLYLKEESIVNPKPNVDYDEIIDESDYNLFLKNFCNVNAKKYKKQAEKVTYSKMYDNIITTKDILMRTGCDAFIPMIRLCDEKLLVVKEKLSSL